jgi:heat shock protein HslJ
MSGRTWAAAAVLVLALAGCGDSDDEPSAAPSTVGTEAAPAGLDGTRFVATSVTGQQLVAGTTLELAFEDGSLAVRAGCNTQSAPYEVDGTTLRWTHEPASTMMACPTPLHDQDEWLADFFTQGAEATVDKVGGTLSNGEVTIELILDESGD